MPMNTARLSFRYSSADTVASLVLLGMTDDCHRCILRPQRPLSCPQHNDSCLVLRPNTTYDFGVDGVFPMRLALHPRETLPPVWEGRYAFEEQSEYTMQAQQLDTGEIHASIVLDHKGSPLWVLTAMLAFVVVWLGWCVGQFLWKRHLASLRDEDEDDTNHLPLLPAQGPSIAAGTASTASDRARLSTQHIQRIKSLDAFRGITVFCMIFVNYGGGGYWQFKHSTWNGLTLADLVFPWFAWIMGMSMSLVPPAKRSLRRCAVRSIKLFALGLFINNGVDFNTWRIPGVLQSFGVSYAIVSAILVRTQAASVVLPAVIMAVLTLLQLLVVYFLPVAGCPTGYVGPGGNGDFGQYVQCTGGAHRAVDLALFGDAHIFQNPTIKFVYDTPSYDPEGVLNWIMVALTTFFGYAVGSIVWHRCSCWTEKGWVLGLSGLVLVVVGAVLCQGRVNDGWIPVNKNLWSITFVLVAAGLGSVVFGGVYLAVDVFHMWSGAPFLYAGMNPILLYCGVRWPNQPDLFDHAFGF
ncbi:hypothetical protein, variant 1 [Aphanomyces invadans]|uniref:Heparan-alpha-glucosaminide N-acetyltransferase catalytic domain-containing protein n=1 Tax=Aphanomyces invadans TaxID=157072 RepID=A0A024U0M0_9STRA|nr:hypothetical protein, variant 1 [Aphanomyces invadans]ETV99167.1 hypothetical protein, variant 1 [Aphanomyces invadans]|eukprot:XP_008872594.1 hypothetical protein, variant 1 [Aphanomyces invadans]